jgi:hypothetical protein
MVRRRKNIPLLAQKRRSRWGGNPILPACRLRWQNGIPAFAGMTFA